MKNFKLTNNKKLLTAVLAGFVLLSGPIGAKANIDDANKVLDEHEIVYSENDSRASNLVMNAEMVLTETSSNGEIPSEYQGMVLDETLIIGSLNQMRENILNHNAYTLFNNPDRFDYLSMGVYLDSEEERDILMKVKDLVNTFAKNPSDLETLDRLVNIFRGNDKEISIYLLNVGGLQALANDVYFVSALVQVYSLEDYYQTFTDLSLSYGDNADIITYIKAINGEHCKTR